MLNDDQIEEVRAFITSPTGTTIFAQLQANLIAEWIGAETTEKREECWRGLQAVQQLQTMLSNAEPMKRMTQRNQERRVYGTRTPGV